MSCRNEPAVAARWLVSAFALGGCTGLIGPVSGAETASRPAESARANPAPGVPASGPGTPSGQAGMNPAAPRPALPAADLAPFSGLRRLTVDEYDNAIRDLLGDDTRGGRLLLPDDPRMPFDNDYTNQVGSKALVEGAELLATDTAARLMKDTARRDRLVGCKPASPADEACLRRFVVAFGRRALRRPLTDEEANRFVALRAVGQMAGDFYAGLRAVVEAFLQHPEFLYRAEIGKPVAGQPGLFALGPYEMAARLSFLVWGSVPDDALLDRAAAGTLAGDGVRMAAVRLFEDPRARTRIARFFALWLGYEELKHDPALVAALQAETSALIGRVVFDEHRPWQDLFRLDETFVSDTLAKHYGLPAAGTQARWIKYGATGRRGLLSHGSFLSAGAKAQDTSPTLRGLFVRERLLCQEVPPPPPNVNTDDVILPANGSPCKAERFRAHGVGGCAGCHQLMDPIGFGLENYDRAGRYRTAEAAHPECTIDGRGDLSGVAFKGPAELSDLLLGSGDLNACVTKQLHRFVVGRAHLDMVDRRLIDAIAGRAGKGDVRFDEMLLDMISAPAFAHRREEQ